MGVTRGDFERELLLSGELESTSSLSIKAPQTAIFQMRIQFMAPEGSIVKPGDPLLDFDNSALAYEVKELETRILDAETQVVGKRAELATALKDLEIELAEKEHAFRSAKLDAGVDADVLAKKEWADRQLAMEKADRGLRETRERVALTKARGTADVDVLVINRDKLVKDLEVAQEGLSLLSIKSPAEGLVVYERKMENNMRYQEGDSCWPGQGILRLPDLSQMQALLIVNEVDAPLLREGMPVTVTLDAFPGREVAGTISRIPSMAGKRSEESKVSVFKVTTALSETWVGEMKPGMSVLGRLVVERREDVPLLPRRAVRVVDGRLLHGNGGKGDAVEITPLARNATHYVLSEEDAARLPLAAGPRS
jgi:multidrug efflux pump subunit AcrA (membrane-fusion protein)